MATQPGTVDFILEQAADAGAVSARALFGEYALYLDGKVMGLICDDTLFLKNTEGARARLDAPPMGPPYPGAKPHIIADTLLDDPEAFVGVLTAIWADLPMPKPKTPRKPKGA